MAIRHSITLSTSEPNNEVGNLKIRQGDEQTQTLVANITENGVPKPFTGLQPFFCAKLGQTAGLGIIEQKVTGPMNPANGTLEYVMQPEDWQQLGRQTAYFSFRKMVNDHEWTEQFSTRDFNYNVTKSAFSEGVKETKKDGSTYVWTIEDMLRLFKEYMATGKTDWEEFVEQNREILESVDPGGKLIGELIDARRPFGGEAYPTIGERLDETDAQLAQTTSELLNISNRAIMQHKAVSVAHRGLNGLAPENTVPAFELACQYGFWGLETDVRQTSDGHFVLYHDATLDTITTGTGKVEDRTLEYIRSLSFKSGGRYENYPNLKIATLEEYLTIAVKYDMHCVIEVTSLYGGALDRVLDIVYKFGMQYKSIMLGAASTINYIRDKDKQIAVGLVTWREVTEGDLDLCASIKPCMMGVAGSAKFLTKEYVELAHSKGVAINTYIINNYGHYLEQIEWGVDIVTTDYILGGSVL